MAGGAGGAGGALRRHPANQGDDGAGPLPVPAAVHGVARTVALVRLIPVVPRTADGDWARFRRGQQRIQPAHTVTHTCSADLSGRAAVWKISGRADDARDQPGLALAPCHRARAVDDRNPARRRGDQPQLSVSAGDDHLFRRLAGAGDVVFQSCFDRRRRRRWSRWACGFSSPSFGRCWLALSRKSLRRRIRAISRSGCKRLRQR